jgi:uncharacterized protein YfaS (alpha-2-macroglobulin family)
LSNAWGRLALDHFAERFEKEPVSGVTSAQLATDSQQAQWTSGVAPELNFEWPTQAANLTLTHNGSGAPWAFVQLRAALPLRKPRFAGYVIKKTYAPVQQKVPGQWSQGDVVEVDLEINAQADMPWVVIDDPLPAAGSHAAPRLDWSDGRGLDPSFSETPFDTYRAYVSFLPKGTWHLRHAFRLDHSGHFGLPPTHVEAMYTPDFLGELPNTAWQIEP